MSADYTADTIARVRRLGREGWPHGAVAAMMGWDLPRLRRFIDLHCITFIPIEAKSKTPDPVRAGIRWDGGMAWHGKKSVYLPPIESRLFNAVLKGAPDGRWSAVKIAKAAAVPKKNVATYMAMLRLSLETIGLTLAKRTYELMRI